MVRIRPIIKEEIKLVFQWSESTEEFLNQWSNFAFPLNRAQIVERIDSSDYIVFIIEYANTPVGTIQIFKIDSVTNSAKVGCYLIDSTYRGKGIGTEALTKVVTYAFKDMKLKKLTLSVFDYNKGAQECYKKCGFKKTGEFQHPNGWIGYNMEICINDVI